MCYPVCGMVHIKEPLLLIGKSKLCGGSGFPLSLSEWSFTICPMPYSRKLSVSLNKTFPFLYAWFFTSNTDLDVPVITGYTFDYTRSIFYILFCKV